MKIKYAILLLVTLSTLFLSGCSSEGINEKLIIHGIGIDREENRYIVTMHVLNTSALSDEGGDKAEQIEVISESGYTLLDAITNIEKTRGKKALYSHNLILVIGKKAAETCTDNILKFFSTDYSLRPSVEILISETTAKDVMNVKSNDKLINADDIMNMVRTSYDKEDQLKFSLKTFLSDTQNGYRDAKAFCINLSQDKLENDVLRIGNMAVFKGSFMQGVLSEDETKGFLIISGKIKNMEQDIEVGGNSFSCLIKKSTCRMETSMENEKPHFNLFINATVNIYNDNLKNSDKMKLELEKKLCELSTKSINKALIEYRCDIFNFSRCLMNADLKYFKSNEENINDIIVNSKYIVNADVKVNCMSKNSSLFEE